MQKKATLESAAKMIASQEEKQKVQNTVLGKIEEITCKDITNINDVDYASCDIAFDENTAKVTIERRGKFDGLNVCDGTKNSSVATKESCTVQYGMGSTYIKNLLAKENEFNNGLVQTTAEYEGTTYDVGIRYVGKLSLVKNKVYYNCDDTDANGVSYGEENYDYASSCEVWRIIGVFDTKSSENGSTEKRVKIINTASTITASWDSSESDINSGRGINQWGESTLIDGREYKGADLMQLLNGYYIGKEGSSCIYCNDKNQETCSQTCTAESLKNANMKVLTNIAKRMIDESVWDTYGVEWLEDDDTTVNFASIAYLQEKGISAQYTGKICTSGNGCNDSVIRTTRWSGLVGLMSVSDMCYANEWLYSQNGNSLYPWSITPRAYQSGARSVWNFGGDSVYGDSTYSEYDVFPSVYLKSNIEIIGGDGFVEPYKLK